MMIDKNSKNIKYPSQLAILLGLTGAGLVASVILSVVIWLMMEGTFIPSKPEDILQPKFYNVNMMIQAVSTLFLFFLPAYFFAKICYKKAEKFLGFNLHINYRQVIIVIAILLLTFPLSGALGELNEALPIPQNWAAKFKSLELSRRAQEAALIQINTFPRYIISLFIIALLPAVFEETYFRAGMQNLFTRWFKGPWIAIIVTSIIFSVIHLSYYGFLVRFGLGVILGFVFHYSRSLWLPILMHFLFNGIQVTALYVMNLSGSKQIKDIEQNFPVWMGVVALAALVYLFIHFKRTSEVELAKYPEDQVPENDFENWVTNQP
jgi:membrane protease YdiL (CAAX protease family)